VVVYTGYGDGSLKPALFDELKTAGITIASTISGTIVKVPIAVAGSVPPSSKPVATMMSAPACSARRLFIWTPAILPVIKEEGVKVVVYTGYGDGSLKPALFDPIAVAGSVPPSSKPVATMMSAPACSARRLFSGVGLISR
jgi:hypothetical protein